MKNFIEVTTNEGKRLININTISFIKETKNGKTVIILLSIIGSDSRFIEARETYEEIKTLIQVAL